MNPYETLGVAKTATDAEIKKSYRKLAAKHHPDKGGDENKFKEINEAYSTIETAQKRQEYENSLRHSGFGDVFGGFEDLFENFFNSPTPRRHPPPRDQSDEEIVFDFKISLAQIKAGLSQNIVFNRNKKCKPCNGIGGKSKSTCPACHGRGIQVSQIGHVIRQTSCQVCRGTGTIIEDRCNSCLGTGMIRERENLSFTIKKD